MTDELKQQLLADLRPVQPASSLSRIALWGVSAVLYVGGLLALEGVRDDIVQRLQTWHYALEIVLAGLVSLVAGAAALLTAVPGTDSRLLRGGAQGGLVLVGVLVFSFAVGVSMQDWTLALNLMHLKVTAMLLAYAVAPAVGLLVTVRRLAPTQLRATCGLIGLAATSLSYLMLRLTLPGDNVVSVLLWCYVPMLLLISLFYRLGRVLLRW